MSTIAKVKEYIATQKILLEVLQKINKYLSNRNLRAAYSQMALIEKQNSKIQELQEVLSVDSITKEEKFKIQFENYQVRIEELISMNQDLLEVEMMLDKSASDYLSKQIARKKQQELGYLKSGQFNDKAVAVHMPALSYAHKI